MTSAKSGRPSKILTEGLVDRVVAAVALGCTYEAACAAGPISVRTFYEWMARAERDEIAGVDDSPFVDFAQRVEAANLEAERRATEIWAGAMQSDWRAARDFLERRFPTRWRRPQTHAVSAVSAGGYVPPTDFLTEEDRAGHLADAIEAWIAARDASATTRGAMGSPS